ncbi:MAG: oligoendopeptidase F [Agathobacter sp.]
MEDRKLRKRQEIPAEYKWKLTDLYETDEQWEEEVEKAKELCRQMKALEGTLGQSAGQLLAFCRLEDELSFLAARICVYANESYHQDTADAKYQGFASVSDSVMVLVSSSKSFADPEILAIPEETLNAFFEEEPGLSAYRRKIGLILREKEHTLSPAEEQILAEAGELAVGPSNIFSMFNNADIKFPSITDVEGNRIQITHGNFIKYMNHKDRSLRKQVFRGVYHTYAKWGNTIAAVFTSNLKQENFYAKMRKYPSVRAMHLSEGNIPEAVYDNLIETVHKHLPAMHRYMALRKKLLGVEHLHMYDLYVPLAKNVEENYSFEEAKTLVAKALAPMGEEYLSIVEEGFTNGWIDVYENENKRSGAYSWAAYGTHPYILLNYQNDLESVFTLAHEMGHAVHSYLSNSHQPVTYADYLIFVAEVASTCNEALLNHYLLENEKDEKKQAFLMNHYLENFRTTLYRQTMFAEFEKIVHEKTQAGEALTMESMNRIYHDLNVLYYGPDMVVDPEIDYEWMRIPHFYNAFYVYQYATGFSAAVAFSRKILKEGKPAVDAYIGNFLCGGSSKDPIDLLSAAGVDMSTPKPVEDALSVFEDCLSRFEEQMN